MREAIQTSDTNHPAQPRIVVIDSAFRKKSLHWIASRTVKLPIRPLALAMTDACNGLPPAL